MSDHVKMCTEHPNYTPVCEPTADCKVCSAMYSDAIRKLDAHRGRGAYRAFEDHIREEKEFRDYLEQSKWLDDGGSTKD